MFYSEHVPKIPYPDQYAHVLKNNACTNSKWSHIRLYILIEA